MAAVSPALSPGISPTPIVSSITVSDEEMTHTLDTLNNQTGVAQQTYLTKLQMHNTMRLVNFILLFAYAFLFVLIHVLYAEQYMRGVKRNEIVDSIFLTVFFCYPYVIYSVESYLYEGLGVLYRLVFGQATIPSFDLAIGNLTHFKTVPPSNPDFA